ncbi:hypothetical protein [Blautia sp. MSJ-36]|uniref:hypothetical protein n=1 Tax=Blautia sp. MSJ-36 TaxID=2841530 RepID=UPI001C118DA0|nr:hypothetical protein [Blautia sp. MSJ-36]MBU5448909.1 hypothetical protein [Blautia sp. MSJ-36]
MDAVESKWYEMDMSLNDAKKLLSSNIKNMSRSFIAAGTEGHPNSNGNRNNGIFVR